MHPLADLCHDVVFFLFVMTVALASRRFTALLLVRQTYYIELNN